MSSPTKPHRPSKWQSCNSRFHCATEKCFGFIGYKIASHPWLTIFISLLVVGGLACGFIRLRFENRTEKLFLPQDSISFKDLDKAIKYFPAIRSREMVILFKNKKGGNVLTKTCLDDVLTLHQAVVSLPKLATYCQPRRGMQKVGNSTKHCLITNPLELFKYNSNKLVNISAHLSAAYNDSSMLMRNGRIPKLNFPGMFSNLKWNLSNGLVQSSTAIQIIYYLQFPASITEEENVMQVEKAFIDQMILLKDNLTCMKIYYMAERSIDDAITESTGQDIVLISITFALMISFTCTMLGKFLNPLTGHLQLAMAGILSVALGIVAGFGLALAVGLPFISIVGVLPFLIIGIGIDDMFIIVDEMDRQDKNLSVVDTIKTVMSHSGNTVTMTTVTDLIAFAVSTLTAFPSIRYFCIYAALSVTLSYLMIMTFFVAIATFDVKRVKANRRDCCPACFAPKPKDGEAAWDEPRDQISNKAMRLWARFLMKTPVRVIVVLLSMGLIGASIYGAMNISENFDRRIVAKENSYFKDFITAQEKHFELNMEISIVMDTKLEYGTHAVQDNIRKLTDIVQANNHYKDTVINWMVAFTQFVKKRGLEINSHENFMNSLNIFLKQVSYFREDIVLSLDNSSIEASRVICFMKDSPSSIFKADAMETLREELKKNDCGFSSYPIAKWFIYFEQYSIIRMETIRNLLIAGAAVFLITWPFLLSFLATILVFLSFSALIVELFGLMVIWNVSLNSVSMINLVMAIGFSVDYSAHIAHAFVTSSEPTAELRVEHALSTLGASVLMGGISTFLGVIVTAFAASEIFRIFFRMFFGIVVLGLLHGLCILPVYLSLICRWKVFKKVHTENEKDNGAFTNPGLAHDPDTNGRPISGHGGDTIFGEKPMNMVVTPIFYRNGSQDTAPKVSVF